MLEGVALQRERGGTPVAELSLAATAAEVLRRPPEDDANPDPTPWLVQLGDVTAVQPPGSLDGQPLRWREPPATYRADRPAWL